jgi:hypothetical protein
VRAFWRQWAVRKGFPARLEESGQPARDLVVEPERTARAYVSDGRWVAGCSFCSGGMAVWPDHSLACCLDCGYIHEIEFPEPEVIAEAVPVLELRPERNRNWKPWVEDVAALVAENMANCHEVP